MTEIGLAEKIIDVPEGTPMGGYAARSRPSEGTHDPLKARAAVISTDDGNRIAICTVDVVGLNKKEIISTKKEIERITGIPPEAVLISATHTHSGPRNIALFGEPWEGSGAVYSAITDAIKEAASDTFSGRVFVGKGVIKGVTYNRREFDKHSNVINDECIVLKFTDREGNIKGIFYNFSNHCVVLNPQNYKISADWPYYTECYLKEKYGWDIYVGFLQGTPGNLNPINVPMSNPFHTFDDVKEIGDATAEQLVPIIESAEEISIDSVSGAITEVMLEFDDEDKAEVFTFADTVEKDGKIYVSTLCQALKLNGIALIGLPGEPCSDIGLELKRRAAEEGRFKAVMVIGYTNDYIGYFALPDVYRAGGYEMLMMSLSENEGPEIIEGAMTAVKKIAK